MDQQDTTCPRAAAIWRSKEHRRFLSTRFSKVVHGAQMSIDIESERLRSLMLLGDIEDVIDKARVIASLGLTMIAVIVLIDATLPCDDNEMDGLGLVFRGRAPLMPSFARSWGLKPADIQAEVESRLDGAEAEAVDLVFRSVSSKVH